MVGRDKVFVIAEAGVNHNGDADLAFRLVDAAADAGADAVKFQTFRAERLVSRAAKKAPYQVRNTGTDDSQYEMIRRLELSAELHQLIIGRCEKKSITFLSSPFDEDSADFLAGLGMSIFKIPSGEIINKNYLKHVASKGKPIILSTGMSNLSEVEQAVDWVRGAGCDELSLLHCVTEYPSPVEQVNLRAMDTLSQAFHLPVGYSDHTEGIEVTVAAVARGARIIEKHFTLSRDLPGPDHKASLEPPEFANMVRSIRNVESCLGDGIKRAVPCEIVNMAVARKSLVAVRTMRKGERLSFEDLSCKRPGNGIAPYLIDIVIGRMLRKDIGMDEVLTWDHV